MKTVNDLKPGDKLTIEGIVMEFAYYSQNHPAFTHHADGQLMTYINKAWTHDTPIAEIK